MTVSLYTADAFGQDMAYKTTALPLEKGAGGIFRMPLAKRRQSTTKVPPGHCLYAWNSSFSLTANTCSGRILLMNSIEGYAMEAGFLIDFWLPVL